MTTKTTDILEKVALFFETKNLSGIIFVELTEYQL